MYFENFSPDARLWLYQSDRALSSTEMVWMQEQLDQFVNEWSAHGTRLKAAGKVLNPYFIALAVDLTQADASGCSIDSSVRFLKTAGAELKVDFFNRLKMLVETEDGTKKLVPFRQLHDLKEEWVFNPLVDRLGDLDSKFRIKVQDFLASAS